MSKWDRRMMEVANLVATWSKDPSTKVGAVIADSNNVVVGQGFNGPPRGVADDPSIDRETKLRRTIHAEMNAILFAGGSVAGCTLYVTHHPCGPCAAMIVQAGISRVVLPVGQSSLSHRWAADICEAEWIFKQAGVQMDAVDMSKEG